MAIPQVLISTIAGRRFNGWRAPRGNDPSARMMLGGSVALRRYVSQQAVSRARAFTQRRLALKDCHCRLDSVELLLLDGF
jgi:hypothetical protein